MSKFKGTPGPWEIVSAYDSHAVTALKDGVRHFVTAGGCGCCNEIEECIDKIEDARLIAAAPELLEALQYAVDVLEDLDMNLLHNVVENGKAAIAKALGEDAP